MNLIITRGDDETLSIAVTDRDTGDAVDLTGATLRFMVKRRRSDGDDDALVDKSTGAGITIESPSTDGLATVTVEDSDTDDVEPGRAFWELQGILAGEVKTLAAGRITIRRDLIRATT